MKTGDLIKALSLEVPPVRPSAMRRDFARWVIPAAAVSVAVMLGTIGLRPDLRQALEHPAIWTKFFIVGSLGMTGFIAAMRSSQPERTGAPWIGVFFAVVVMAGIAGAVQLFGYDESQWMMLWLGSTSAQCPFIIAGLALPILAAALWVMGRCAPSNLRLAGAAAGIFAGGLSALVYSFHCSEAPIAFVATWYVGGIVAVGALGALIGPRVLRW
ncbi:MAG TPA: DUF1109 domain-containing protein [Micropepsaceae bacterium]|nr:DUF1109 domain-containing protein [Micropepsaceae bacterium]